MFGKNLSEEQWISGILRLAMASLFLAAAVGKFLGGLGTTAGGIEGMFQSTWLPHTLVSVYARLLPFAELLVPVWLISGTKLREAWAFTALLLVSLGFGLSVAKQPSTDCYMLALLSCVGLYFSRFDTCNCFKKQK